MGMAHHMTEFSYLVTRHPANSPVISEQAKVEVGFSIHLNDNYIPVSQMCVSYSAAQDFQSFRKHK